MKFTPWPYQQYTIDRIIDNSCGPLLDMGLGKTVAALTAMDKLLKAGEVKRILVIAPLRIADEVWSTEVKKWDHLKHLKVSKVLGTETKRKKALLAKADIYIINRENVAWLVAYYAGAFPFDAVILDESSSFKDPSSRRFKALRQVAPMIKRKYILTGTPIPNGLLGMWSQVYFLDSGERLGKSFPHYRATYFEADKRDRHTIFSYKLKQGDEMLGSNIFEKEVHQKIGDVCFSMKAKDYLDLPERIDLTREVVLSDSDKSGYDKFEREQVLALKSGEDITALTAAALTNKLLQYANGAVYYDSRKYRGDYDSRVTNYPGDGVKREQDYHVVHDAKLDVLEEMIEALDGHPVLIFYSYRHDLERMKQRLKRHKPIHLQTSEDIASWNASIIPVMLAHPGSAGHGLNLQDGGNNIIWFGLPWGLELWQQANARLHRQGQVKPVYIHKLITKGTLDERVLEALENKTGKQEALMNAVKALVEKYR